MLDEAMKIVKTLSHTSSSFIFFTLCSAPVVINSNRISSLNKCHRSSPIRRLRGGWHSCSSTWWCRNWPKRRQIERISEEKVDCDNGLAVWWSQFGPQKQPWIFLERKSKCLFTTLRRKRDSVISETAVVPEAFNIPEIDLIPDLGREQIRMSLVNIYEVKEHTAVAERVISKTNLRKFEHFFSYSSWYPDQSCPYNPGTTSTVEQQSGALVPYDHIYAKSLLTRAARYIPWPSQYKMGQ